MHSILHFSQPARFSPLAELFRRLRRGRWLAQLTLLLLAVGPAASGAFAAESSNLTNCAADLQHITGGKIEIRCGPLMAMSPSLPFFCQVINEAFRDAAADPETGPRLSQIVHMIDVEGLLAGDEMHHVRLKNEVMLIQTGNTRDALDSLRPLIVEVLKKVAHLDAKRELH